MGGMLGGFTMREHGRILKAVDNLKRVGNVGEIVRDLEVEPLVMRSGLVDVRGKDELVVVFCHLNKGYIKERSANVGCPKIE